MAVLPPINFKQWIEDHKKDLQPPVSNETIYKGNDNFIVMVSGGPNTRKDFHYNESEELFYQVEGGINVKIVDEGEFKDVPIKEGEMFLLPPKVLHSPQRPDNTVGLIIEKHREPGEKDGFVYFCDNCGHQLYEEYFFLEDIVKQFPVVMHNFYSSKENRTCDNCGHVMELPENWNQNLNRVSENNEYAEQSN